MITGSFFTSALIVAAYANWGLSGNAARFRHYATPPSGLFTKELRLAGGSRLSDGFVDLKAPGEDDYRLLGVFRLNGGNTRGFATDFRNRFFPDPSPDAINPSQRRVSEAFITQKLTPKFALSFRTRLDHQTENLLEPLDQNTRITNVAARGGLWPNALIDLSYTDWRYQDRTAVLPNTQMQRWSAGLTQVIGDSASLGGSYSHSFIRQPGNADDKIDEITAGGNLELGEDTSLIADYRDERLSLPSVLEAYDRRRQQLRTRIVHRFDQGWNLQLGYDQLALERVVDDHTRVDVPRYHTVDVRLSGRLSPRTRLTADVSHQALQGRPEIQLPDPRGLYWTGKTDLRLKLDTANPVTHAYAVFDWHEQRNSQRDVVVRHQGLTVGFESDLKPELQIYGEISTDLWSGRTGDPLNPDLGAYFPDATTLTAGLNWTIDRRSWLTANYTYFNSTNANPLFEPDAAYWGSLFTGSLHFRPSRDVDLSLTLAPWRYADLFYANRGFTANVLQLAASMKF